MWDHWSLATGFWTPSMLTAMAPDWDKLFPQIGSGDATVVQYGLYCIPSYFLAYM